MSTTAYSALFSIAEDQFGFITSRQAAEAGVRPMTLVMMARRGTIERASHGVYRLRDFPVNPLSQYMQATFWPVGVRGVLSHETALTLYALSDVAPTKVHITVPSAFRIQRKVPAYLTIHRADLVEDDMQQFERMPITTPSRSIEDCMAANVGPAIIKQAIHDGRRAGLLDPSTAAALEYLATR